MTTSSAPAPLTTTGLIPGAQLGVLFDIDDTLVDLVTAQRTAFAEIMAVQLRRLPGSTVADDAHSLTTHPRFHQARDAFVHDGGGHYQAYIDGRLSFIQQRLNRAEDALHTLGLTHSPDENLWAQTYESTVKNHWALFDDVVPMLRELEAAGIAYGAVSNNVEDYQRAKLAQVGLAFDVVIGTDTAGAPKPDPRPFHAGKELLGVDQAVMVGDNPVADGVGAREAGLFSVLLDRNRNLNLPDGVFDITSLAQLMPLLFQLSDRD